MPKKRGIHRSIKTALGYDQNEPDQQLLTDWKARTKRVCKPCWELKYCPYGPLVEQSPTLPPLRDGVIEQIAYFKQCLTDNTVGNVVTLSEEDRHRYAQWVDDEQLLLRQAIHESERKRILDEAGKLPTDDEKIRAWMGGPLPPIHIYRVPYEYEDAEDIDPSDFSEADWTAIRALADAIKKRYQLALTTGELDGRSPLEPTRAAWFRQRIADFNADDHPEEIPEVFTDGQCNVYGHVCPVFFSAEASTETSTERRRGR